jgi:hypothetical protein
MSLHTETQTSNEWHVLKGETKYGPYTYVDMIQMLQNKMLFGFDYAWAPHLETWTTLADLAEFSQDRLSRLAEKSGTEVFNKRSTDRVYVSIPVVCHDNSRMWTGTCENLSKGGALILMENPILLPGHLVSVHFRVVAGDDTAFNCNAEILTKRLTKQRIQHDTEITYAVKFIQILPSGENQITKWIKENKKTA